MAPCGMKFQSPDGTSQVEQYSNAFEDNTQNVLNDAPLPAPWSPEKVTGQLQAMAQSWEKILFCLGTVQVLVIYTLLEVRSRLAKINT